MPATDDSDSRQLPAREVPFASFSGTLTAARVAHLLAKRTPVDRTVSLLKLLILVGALGGLVVLPFSNQQLHSSALAEGGWKFAFGITLLLLFAHVARRRQASDGRSWCRGNAPLLGTYHVALFDECLSITTDHVALVVGYEAIANVESRRDCIRLSFDTGGLRGILLPFDDAAPQRPGPELLSFLQERLRERRTSGVAVEPLGQHQQPLLEALRDQPRREFDGPLLQVDLAQTAEQIRKLYTRVILIVLAIWGLLLLANLAAIGASGGDVAGYLLARLMPIGTVSLVLFVTRYRASLLKQQIQDDPDAVADDYSGFVTASGLSVTRNGNSGASITWEACDDVNASDSRLVIGLWPGELLILTPAMFECAEDYKAATDWAKAGI